MIKELCIIIVILYVFFGIYGFIDGGSQNEWASKHSQEGCIYPGTYIPPGEEWRVTLNICACQLRWYDTCLIK